MRAAIRRFLSRPTATWLAAALGVLLATPSLTAGLVADDWLQLLVARQRLPWPGVSASRFDLFSFAGHDPRMTPRLVDAGLFPWWTDPEVKLAFFRPLSSLTHVVDWTLWPGSPLLMHLHSLAWLALALVAVVAVYRRLFAAFGGDAALASWGAGLAALLYAIDDAHGPAVGWVANRNAMIAVAAAMPVLLAHDRWRRQRWQAGVVVAPLLLGVALLAGEAALAVVAYLAAYALCLERGAWTARARSLAPYLVVVVAWRIVYARLGYGTAHSGVYLDPGASPADFARAAPARIAFLLASQLALPWSDLAELWRYLSPHVYAAMLGLAVAVVVLAAALFAPLVRRDPLARFFAVGALGAVVPVASTFPADRLLWFVGVGAMGLVARWLTLRPRAAWAAAVAALFVLVHVVLAAPLYALRSRSNLTVGAPMLRAEASLPPSASLGGATVVFVNPPADLFVGYVVLLRAARGQPLPPARWLATGTSTVHVARADARTLRVTVDGGFYPFSSEHMLRDPRRRFTVGQRVVLSGLTIEVTALEPDGRPAEVRARFDHDLDDRAALRFFAWRAGVFVPWTPPPVGGAVTMPATDFLDAVFGKH